MADQSHGYIGVETTTTTMTNDDDDEHLIPAALSQLQENTVAGALPDDLLVVILEWSLYLESESGFSPSYDVRALLVVSAVCRHWRWSALHTPSLWSYIPSFLSLNLVQLFLERSAGLFLHVDFVCNNYFIDHRRPFIGNENLMRKADKFLAKLEAVLRHSNRVRYMSLCLESYAITTIDSELAKAGTNCRTPVLEGLLLQDSSEFQWGVSKAEHFSNADLSLYSKFRSPLLRVLRLDGVRIPHNSIHVASLSQLSMQITGAHYSLKDYLISVLEHGVSLVSLSLDMWSTSLMFRDGDPTGDTISLPQLRRLVIKAPFDQCLQFIHMLSVQSLDEIRFETRHSPIRVEDAAQLIPVSPPGDRARIEVNDHIIRLDFAMSEEIHPYAQEPFSFTLDTRYGQDMGIADYNSNILLGLLKPHQFAHILSVDLRTLDVFDAALMSPFLSHFGSLNYLRIHLASRSESSPIEDAISLSTLRSQSSHLQPLQSLIFRNFTVKIPQAVPFLIELCEIVRERTKSGLPLLVPEFQNCKGITDALLRTCGLKTT